jgi:hypothetical protein
MSALVDLSSARRLSRKVGDYSSNVLFVTFVDGSEEEVAPVVGSTDQSVTRESGFSGLAALLPIAGNGSFVQCCGATLWKSRGSPHGINSM